MKKNRLPRGWTKEKVDRVMTHYESQSDEQAVAEDEAAYRSTESTSFIVPIELVPNVRRLLARKRTATKKRVAAKRRSATKSGGPRVKRTRARVTR